MMWCSWVDQMKSNEVAGTLAEAAAEELSKKRVCVWHNVEVRG